MENSSKEKQELKESSMRQFEELFENEEETSLSEELSDEQKLEEAFSKLPPEELKFEEEFQLESEFANPEEAEDIHWKERTGLTEDTLCGAIESIIFMSDKPIRIERIRDMIDKEMPLRILYDSLSRLQQEYEAAHHGIRLQEVAEGYQFRTKPLFANQIKQFFSVQSLVLSPTALEVLSIVAYKQPISRMAIDKIRGIDSSHIMRALMDRRLIRIVGRTEELGKPAAYGTSEEFLDVFNLKSLSELPEEHEIEALIEKNEVGEIKDIREYFKGDSDAFKFDDFQELEDLQGRIKSVDTETFFTKNLKQDKDSEESKSAFDLLEEHIALEASRKQNRKALDSEVLTTVAEPEVVKDLQQDFSELDVEEDDLLFTEERPLEEDQLADALDQAFEKLQESRAEFDSELEEESEDLVMAEDAAESKNAEISQMLDDWGIQENTSEEDKDSVTEPKA